MSYVPDMTKRRLCSPNWILHRLSLLGSKAFEARVTEKLAELKRSEARTVDDESMPALRGKLVDLAKETAAASAG